MRKTFFVTLVSLAFFSFTTLAGSNLTIEYFDGQGKTEALSTLGKLVFQGDNMKLLSKTNEILAESPISEVKKIVFTEITTSVPSLRTEESIVVYPNPSDDKLFIKGVDPNEVVRIFDMKGVVLKSVTTSSRTEIDVRDIAKGQYILQIGTDILKFIKK